LDSLIDTRHGSIWLCLPKERMVELGLASIDDAAAGAARLQASADLRAVDGTSVADRVRTVRALCSPDAVASEFREPGNTQILGAEHWGGLKRPSPVRLAYQSPVVEAATDLARAAGLYPAAVASLLFGSKGDVLSEADAVAFAQSAHMGVIRINDLIAHRWTSTTATVRLASTRLPLRADRTVAIHAYRTLVDGREAVTLVRGSVNGAARVPVFIHRYSVLSQVFAGSSCECGIRFVHSFDTLVSGTNGILIDLIATGRDAIGLAHVAGHAPVPLDLHDLGFAAQVLQDLQPGSIVPLHLASDEAALLVMLYGSAAVTVRSPRPAVQPALSERG
jgi:3,4-dihydroxy 2-butanone 4-phosphate synthase/GTP cyclohydrolase II